MKMKVTAIASSLILLLAIQFMCGVAEIAPPLNCRSSHKILNRKVGKQSHGVSFPLFHIFSECSPFRPPNRTWESLISEKIRADANRLHFLNRTSRSSKEDASANVPVSYGSGEYIIQVDFGTPKQSMYTLIDTGSNVAWIPCKQCQGCPSTAPTFDPTASSSYKPVACDSQLCQQNSDTNCGGNSKCQFEVLYGDGTQVDGALASDAITLGSENVPNFAFGCAESVREDTYSSPGLMGLGGGSLSLLNQPSTTELFGGTFSYCLPSSSASSGSLVLGKEAAISTPGLKFTKLVNDPSNPTFYAVNLIGISVGDTRISLAAGEGTIVDSGTTITHLVDSDYASLRDTFRGQLPTLQPASSDGFDTCYDFSSSSVDVPTITLHMDNNVDLLLPKENIVMKQDSGLSCLAFTSSDSGSIIGNVQQQNWRIVFDVPNSKVGFAQEQCSAPA